MAIGAFFKSFFECCGNKVHFCYELQIVSLWSHPELCNFTDSFTLFSFVSLWRPPPYSLIAHRARRFARSCLSVNKFQRSTCSHICTLFVLSLSLVALSPDKFYFTVDSPAKQTRDFNKPLIIGLTVRLLQLLLFSPATRLADCISAEQMSSKNRLRPLLRPLLGPLLGPLSGPLHWTIQTEFNCHNKLGSYLHFSLFLLQLLFHCKLFRRRMVQSLNFRL